jgi:gas vesicle protein
MKFFISYVMTRGKIVLGALAGIAAGALIGILFAPDKGSATRKKIVHKGEEYVDNLKGKIAGLMNNGEHQKGERVRESAA